MLDNDMRLGIFALILAAALFALGTSIKAGRCEELSRDTGKPHQYSIEHGCLAEVKPGVWAKVAALSGWQEFTRP